MLGDHAKSPSGVVPDALNGCTHPVGVIPRFLPFLPPISPPSLLPLTPPVSVPRTHPCIFVFLICPLHSLSQHLSHSCPAPSSLSSLRLHFSFHSRSALSVSHPLFRAPPRSSLASRAIRFLALPLVSSRPLQPPCPPTFTHDLLRSPSLYIRILLSARLTQQLFNHPRRTKVAETNRVSRNKRDHNACIWATVYAPFDVPCLARSSAIARGVWTRDTGSVDLG